MRALESERLAAKELTVNELIGLSSMTMPSAVIMARLLMCRTRASREAPGLSATPSAEMLAFFTLYTRRFPSGFRFT